MSWISRYLIVGLLLISHCAPCVAIDSFIEWGSRFRVMAERYSDGESGDYRAVGMMGQVYSMSFGSWDGYGSPRFATSELVLSLWGVRFPVGLAYVETRATRLAGEHQITLGVQFLGRLADQRFQLAWRHYSNAGTRQPNMGEDFVVFGLIF